MTVDREQTRRDAIVDATRKHGSLGTAYLALLAELEQAERTLSSVSATLAMVEDRLKQAERERDEEQT